MCDFDSFQLDGFQSEDMLHSIDGHVAYCENHLDELERQGFLHITNSLHCPTFSAQSCKNAETPLHTSRYPLRTVFDLLVLVTWTYPLKSISVSKSKTV